MLLENNSLTSYIQPFPNIPNDYSNACGIVTSHTLMWLLMNHSYSSCNNLKKSLTLSQTMFPETHFLLAQAELI